MNEIYILSWRIYLLDDEYCNGETLCKTKKEVREKLKELNEKHEEWEWDWKKLDEKERNYKKAWEELMHYLNKKLDRNDLGPNGELTLPDSCELSENGRKTLKQLTQERFNTLLTVSKEANELNKKHNLEKEGVILY